MSERSGSGPGVVRGPDVEVASEVAERTSTRVASFLPPRGWSPELEERGAHKVTARAFV